MTTAEYLKSFLPASFAVSMDAMTEEALADALDDLTGSRCPHRMDPLQVQDR